MISSVDYSASEKAEVMPFIAVSIKLVDFAFLKKVGLAWTLYIGLFNCILSTIDLDTE